jgi:hypothetical protein
LSSGVVRAMWILWRRRPDLLSEHTRAYADLITENTAAWLAFWLSRVVWVLAAMLFMVVGLTLTGVAVMLAGFGPQDTWSLVAVPSVSFVLAGVCGCFAIWGRMRPSSEALRAQWDADCRLLAREEA